MPSFVHVARILKGQREAFSETIRTGFEAGAPALKAFGFTKITSFFTPELADGEDGLLVTVYEAKDASVVEKFYSMQAVIDQEAKAHGVLVKPHDHASLPTNVPFLELTLE
jgi:hypothetical protein